jgi:hypothetical protein
LRRTMFCPRLRSRQTILLFQRRRRARVCGADVPVEKVSVRKPWRFWGCLWDCQRKEVPVEMPGRCRACWRTESVRTSRRFRRPWRGMSPYPENRNHARPARRW